MAEVGEFGFLDRILSEVPLLDGTRVGPGQDCAVIRCGQHGYLFTIDALVADTHFRAAWLTPRQIGRKAFLINASDIAAMGGTPEFCVVALGAPADYLARDLRAVQRGIVEAARECGAAVVGGNLTRTRQLTVTIALLGRAAPRIVTRQGARPGDHVFVTGTLGDAALAVYELNADQRPPAALLRRFCEPQPRLQAGRVLTAQGIASAMIDVSDGLVQDLGHVCEQSNVGAIIHAACVPRSAAYKKLRGTTDLLAVHGGEDYELLFTVPERQLARLARSARRLGCPVTRLGYVTHGGGVRLLDADGRPLRPGRRGYDHFRGPAPSGKRGGA
jgi:thiamine-monophosphate kinase